MDYFDITLKIVLAILALFGVQSFVNKISIKLKNQSNALTLQKSSEENVGRDKIVTIHNYNISAVGNKDTLLGMTEIAGSAPEQPATETNFRIIALSRLQNLENTPLDSSVDVQRIESFFQKVFDESKSQRNAASLMSGAFFAIASEGTNPEWQEHCASSLREFFHEWKGGAGSISTAFNLVKGGATNFPSMKSNSNFYSRMAVYYDYFSEKCHHGHSESVRKLRVIHNDVEIKTEDQGTFKRTISMFLSELFEVIKTVEI